VTLRNHLLAFAVAAAFVGASPMSFAQSSSPTVQTDQDHSAHHPGAAKPGPKSPSRGGKSAMGKGAMMDGDMGQMMSMMRDMMTMMGVQTGMMAPNAEGRIASLKTELKITDAQELQWDRFADALRATAKSMNGMFGHMMQPDPTQTLTARLDGQEKMLSAHLNMLKWLKDTLEPLYASFSDDQKKLADKLTIGPMGMM
jgi:hypothetical protein